MHSSSSYVLTKGLLTTMQISLVCNLMSSLGVVLFLHGTSAQDLQIDLDYGSFQGKLSSEDNITYWTKIPFTAPPNGTNRLGLRSHLFNKRLYTTLIYPFHGAHSLELTIQNIASTSVSTLAPGQQSRNYGPFMSSSLAVVLSKVRLRRVLQGCDFVGVGPIYRSQPQGGGRRRDGYLISAQQPVLTPLSVYTRNNRE
jgi:hypothetical protein